MPGLSKEPRDGYHGYYYSDEDSFKWVITEGKLVKRDENTIELFALWDGVKADPVPTRIALHKSTWKKYDFQTKKEIDVEPGPVEQFIFEHLDDEELLGKVFSATFVHYGSVKEYGKKLPLQNIDFIEGGELPPIPEPKNGNGKTYADAGESQIKILDARRKWILTEVGIALEAEGKEIKLESFADLHLLLQEEPDLKAKIDPLVCVLLQVCG